MTLNKLNKGNKIDTLNADHCVEIIEDIFFEAEGNCKVEYRKLDVNSNDYDKEYDLIVRRDEINNLYTLDEMITDLTGYSFSIVEFTGYIENQLIDYNLDKKTFILNIEEITTNLRLLQKAATDSIEFFEEKITEDDYINLYRSYKINKTPLDKTQFLQSIKDLSNLIDEKLDIL